MGRGIANAFATNGHRVSIVDRDPLIADRAKSSIERDLEVAIEEGFVARSDLETIVKRITPTADLEDAVEKAGLVVEAVPEELELKLGIWRRLGEVAAEDAILATNTSSFDINELAKVVQRRPERVIGTHWYNPAHIVPCVEVVPADATSDQTIASIVELLRRLGKEPAVTKSVPGFVGNRIQLVMAAEAFRCVEQGIATPEAVDAIVRSSFGFRLGAFGPWQSRISPGPRDRGQKPLHPTWIGCADQPPPLPAGQGHAPSRPTDEHSGRRVAELLVTEHTRRPGWRDAP